MSSTQKTILNILAQLETQDPNDPRVSDQIDDIVDLLTEDEEEAIRIIKELDENQLAWITPVFEELSFTFQSQKFITCISELGRKHPNIEGIEEDIDFAKTVLEE